MGITDDDCDRMLAEDITRAEAALDRALPWWRGLGDVRQRMLLNMEFNLGGRLLGFRHALAAMHAADWTTAAAEMRNSLWALQVGARAARLSRAMETGEMPSN